MKKSLCIIIILLLVMSALVVIRLLTPEDQWLCKNNEWVKQGNPKTEPPAINCEKELYSEDSSEIIIDAPIVNEQVVSPLAVSGQAIGTWFFEASFPIKIYDANYLELGTGYVTAQDDWMTEDLVPFEGTIEFSLPTTTTGWLIFHNDNPSGLPQYDRQIALPIKFKSQETTTVKLFFPNIINDPEFLDCSWVEEVERQIPKVEAIGTATINELLKGPSVIEKQQGYITSINQGVILQSLKIEDGVAYADFNEQLDYQVGGSCLVTSIRSQIEKTLKQFDTVDQVIISINGESETILQP